MWQPIETAPKDRPIICWATGWERPIFLCWKTSLELIAIREMLGRVVQNRADSYFGYPPGHTLAQEDYFLAEPGKGPTHWHPLEPVPTVAGAPYMVKLGEHVIVPWGEIRHAGNTATHIEPLCRHTIPTLD